MGGRTVLQNVLQPMARGAGAGVVKCCTRTEWRAEGMKE